MADLYEQCIATDPEARPAAKDVVVALTSLQRAVQVAPAPNPFVTHASPYAALRDLPWPRQRQGK